MVRRNQHEQLQPFQAGGSYAVCDKQQLVVSHFRSCLVKRAFLHLHSFFFCACLLTVCLLCSFHSLCVLDGCKNIYAWSWDVTAIRSGQGSQACKENCRVLHWQNTSFDARRSGGRACTDKFCVFLFCYYVTLHFIWWSVFVLSSFYLSCSMPFYILQQQCIAAFTPFKMLKRTLKRNAVLK